MIQIHPAFLYFLGAGVILLLRRDRLAGQISAITGIAGLYFTLLLKESELVSLVTIPPLTSFLLRVDGLSLFAGTVFALIGFLAILYASSLKDSIQHAAALIYMGSALGVVFAGDLLSLYIFWELMALASLAIIWRGSGASAGASGYRYILMHAVGGALLLGGIVTEWAMTGSLVLSVPEGIPLLFILLGVGLNAAFIPLHTWLPDAYPEASVYGTVFLGIFTTKTAIYLLARMCAGTEYIAWMGAIMAIYGAIFALFQKDIRRLLSYSIVSQLGYMVAAVAAGGAAGIGAALAHMESDLIFKSLLFMCAGVFILATGENTLRGMKGIGRREPLTAVLLVAGLLSLAGFPFFNGFVSKGLVLDVVHGGGIGAVQLLLVLASILTVMYVLRLAWFMLSPGCEHEIREKIPYQMRISMGILGALCLGMGVFPSVLLGTLPMSIHYDPFEVAHITESMLVAALGCILLFAGRNLLLRSDSMPRDIDAVYIYAGRAFLSACRGPLVRGASKLEELFVQNVVDRLAWFAQNPVRVFRIFGYWVLTLLARFMLPAEQANRYAEDLARCRKGYPGDPSRIWGTGYGILLVSLLFLMYLVFLFFRG
ncbi:MAG: proton-conducting transporter membrane subunit [Methanomicrobiales archaeon]|nr:proton-conducting transporter membrane subunit [Methanomicrobiales archaeon]